MSAGGHILRNRIAVRASVDLNTMNCPGVFALEAPTNGPNANDCLVEIYVAVDGASRLIAQRTIDLVDNSVSHRLYNGSSWGSWSSISGSITGGLAFKGSTDCSGNPNYPAAVAGDTYIVSVAGKIGGASGVSVNPGDLFICEIDNAGGTQAGVGADWAVIFTNHDGVVSGPASAVADNFATFNLTTGKLIKDSGLALDTAGTLAANSDLKIPSQKAVKTYTDAALATAEAFALPISYLDTNTSLAANSDTKVPSQKAVKAYVDAASGTGIPLSYLDTDGTLAANSDTKIATQKATKTYADTKLPSTYLDTDITLAANSDVKIASQKAAKSYIDTGLALKLPTSYLDTDTTLAANSDTRIPSQRAIKTYVDIAVQGLNQKPTARLATAVALSPTNTYSAGVLTAGGVGALSVDGQVVVAGDVILVKNEASGLKNGLYTVTTVGDGSTAYVLTRHVDMDVSAEFHGAFIPVDSEGTANSNSLWLCTNTTAPTVGTTAITFVQLNKGTDLQQGTGITISGNTVSIGNAAITYALIQNVAALSVFGRSANTSGVGADITGVDGNVLRVSGTSLGFGAIATAGITDAAVTHAKFQNIAGLSVVGRSANSSGVGADITGTDGQVLRVAGTALGFGAIATAGLPANQIIATIQVILDGGGSALTTGMKGYLEVPFGCTITQVTALADQSGSVVVDIFKCTYANFDAGSTHPVSGDKITSTTPPTITTATKSQDATLTSWTTAISAGDILGFNVNSATTITRVTISLKVNKT